MPLAWYDVLLQLAEAPDRRLRMAELADRVLLSRSGLTRLVDRLQADGLVTPRAVARTTRAARTRCSPTPGCDRLRGGRAGASGRGAASTGSRTSPTTSCAAGRRCSAGSRPAAADRVE